MLEIRYLRSGRRNTAFFRVVLTEKSKPPKSGFKEILGWYNPITKESSLKKEEILSWLDKGAQTSNSVAKLLEQNQMKHKSIKFVPHAPKASKSKGKDEPAKAANPTEAPEVATETKDVVADEQVAESSEEVKEETAPEAASPETEEPKE